MNRSSTRSFVPTLSYYKTATDNFSTLACRGCRGSLDIHQPDQTQPEHFLGTCSSCGKWYRVLSSGKAGLTVLELPEPGQIDAAPNVIDGKT